MGEERSIDNHNIHHDISLCHHSYPWLGLGVIICPSESLKRREDVDVGMEMSLPTPHRHTCQQRKCRSQWAYISYAQDGGSERVDLIGGATDGRLKKSELATNFLQSAKHQPPPGKHLAMMIPSPLYYAPSISAATTSSALTPSQPSAAAARTNTPLQKMTPPPSLAAVIVAH
eukprot:scaffold17533_cov113-Skeletonema_dohrnii-CCMP3373.AAC.2